MDAYGWILIIVALIWVINIFLLRNSYKEWHWSYSYNYEFREKVWRKEDRLIVPLWMFIPAAISLLIPVLNVIIALLVLIFLIIGYYNKDIYLHIDFPE